MCALDVLIAIRRQCIGGLDLSVHHVVARVRE